MKGWAQDVFRVTDGLAPRKLESPIDLPLDEGLIRVFRLAWWADDGALPALRAELPSPVPLDIDWERTMMFGIQEGVLLTIGCEDSEARWEQVSRIERVAATLKFVLPEGARLELAVGGPGPMRALGVLRNQAWSIDQVYPPMDKKVLQRALELARQAEEDDVLVAASEDSAEAAEATLRAEWSLDLSGNPGLERSGKVLRVTEKGGDIRSWMLMFGGSLLVHDPEFCSVWGLQSKLDDRLAELQSTAQQLSGLGLQFALGINAHYGLTMGELIHIGKKARFHRSDIRQSRWLRSEEVDSTDQELEALGFLPLGDLMADSLAGVVLRAYGCLEGDCWALVNAGVNHLFIREFFSHCQGGIRLTTTSLPFAKEVPAQMLFKQSRPELEFGELLTAHRSEILRRGWVANPCPSQLKALAESIDEYLVLDH
ncbi:hypothetical protein IV102_09070 [bacterium]|nr:hypothetical protein [bacterium]